MFCDAFNWLHDMFACLKEREEAADDILVSQGSASLCPNLQSQRLTQCWISVLDPPHLTGLCPFVGLAALVVVITKRHQQLEERLVTCPTAYCIHHWFDNYHEALGHCLHLAQYNSTVWKLWRLWSRWTAPTYSLLLYLFLPSNP